MPEDKEQETVNFMRLNEELDGGYKMPFPYKKHACWECKHPVDKDEICPDCKCDVIPQKERTDQTDTEWEKLEKEGVIDPICEACNQRYKIGENECPNCGSLIGTFSSGSTNYLGESGHGNDEFHNRFRSR
jgi:RNA polymerase subunit RPABC4/transcription elongation factor Spt4